MGRRLSRFDDILTESGDKTREGWVIKNSYTPPKPESRIFRRQLEVGNDSKAKLASYLTKWGFRVKDISQKHLTPFDLVVRNPATSSVYLVDVERIARYNYPVSLRDYYSDHYYVVDDDALVGQEQFKTSAIKLIVFDKRGEGFRYIRVDEIRSACKYSGRLHIVKIESTAYIKQLANI